jgi:hypothetical protein
MSVTPNANRSWQAIVQQIVDSLRTLGIVGWPLVAVIAVGAIVLCWIPYLFLKFGDGAVDLAGELLKSIAVPLIKELNGSLHHPAAQLERVLLIFLLVACVVFGILWISSALIGVEGRPFLVAAACVFLVLIIAAFQSGNFAKHLL